MLGPPQLSIYEQDLFYMLFEVPTENDWKVVEALIADAIGELQTTPGPGES
jgi:hypothetical protein